MINNKKSKLLTIVLSLCMIVAISISTIAFAEGSGENWQGREFYKTHYISTNVLVKDNDSNAPSRFFLQADMPIELTLLGQDTSLEPNMLQSIRIKGYSSSARNVYGSSIIYGDSYEGYDHITSIENYSINSNLTQNSLEIVLDAHLSNTTNFNAMTSTLLSINNTGATEHSVFTQGYGVIRANVPVFDTNGNLTEYSTTGMIDYFSQYTYFSKNPYVPYTSFTVGTQPLDLSSPIYFKECYYYGYNNNYGKYYLVSGNQIGAFKVYCWSNSSVDLSDNTLTSGYYLVIPSSIPSVLVTKDVDGNFVGDSIHLSYTSALGTQLDNVGQWWYDSGYQEGNIFGYNQGYGAGYNDGIDIGFENGKSEGAMTQFTFDRLIFSVIEAPVKVLLSTFKDVTILGLDLTTAIISILTLVIIAFVVKFVLSLFSANTSVGDSNTNNLKNNLRNNSRK